MERKVGVTAHRFSGRHSSRLSTSLVLLSIIVLLLCGRFYQQILTNEHSTDEHQKKEEELLAYIWNITKEVTHLSTTTTAYVPSVSSKRSLLSSLGYKTTTTTTTSNNKNDTTIIDFRQSLSSSSPPWAFFYNIYIPYNSKNNGALEIIQEQLGQLRSSYAARAHSETTLNVYYNTIGTPINQTFMDRICKQDQQQNYSSINCIHMEHFDAAFEETTLRRVREYCIANPQHRVGYMHNKGSFHQRSGNQNTYWRRHMTLAISDELCIHPPDDTCDMCGLNFYTLPWLHFSGNFFVAKCSYISKLLPIEDFHTKMVEIGKRVRDYETQSRFLFEIMHGSPAMYMGGSRYANEVWAGSHPSLVACDLSTERKVDFWKKEQPNIQQYWNFSLAPRPTDLRGRVLHIRKTLRNQATFRMREYYLLAGNMLKWIHLYHTIPFNSSWVWSYFPDGDVWRDGFRVFGQDVVESLLDPYAIHDGNLSSPIFENVTKFDTTLTMVLHNNNSVMNDKSHAIHQFTTPSLLERYYKSATDINVTLAAKEKWRGWK